MTLKKLSSVRKCANTNLNYNDNKTWINIILLGKTNTSKNSNVGRQATKPLANQPTAENNVTVT